MLTRALLIGLLITLAGCGFQLRGSASLPYESLYVAGADPDMGVELQRAIRNTQTRVVGTAEDAQGTLQVMFQGREKQILTISGAGQVSEYRLIYRVGFRVHDNAGKDLLPTQNIELQREMTFDPSRTLAKESEEALLYRDMQTDAVQQIIRRMAAAKPAR
jgi:LPS-assembly lipoprotein